METDYEIPLKNVIPHLQEFVDSILLLCLSKNGISASATSVKMSHLTKMFERLQQICEKHNSTNISKDIYLNTFPDEKVGAMRKALTALTKNRHVVAMAAYNDVDKTVCYFITGNCETLIKTITESRTLLFKQLKDKQ